LTLLYRSGILRKVSHYQSRQEERRFVNNREYISVGEASESLGVTRPTLYYYMKTQGIETKKFELDRKAYMRIDDFERIKKLKENAASREVKPKEQAA
jgi:hypothetical protein